METKDEDGRWTMDDGKIEMMMMMEQAYQWVAYAKENDTVLQAFLKMQKMGVQGLAVIDATVISNTFCSVLDVTLFANLLSFRG